MIIDKLQSIRSFALNSQCQLAFIKQFSYTEGEKIIPVLMLTGITSSGDNPYVWLEQADAKIGIIESNYNSNNINNPIEINVYGNNDQPFNINPYKGIDHGDWLIISEQDINDGTYQIVYPRIVINSLELQTDTNSLIVKYGGIDPQGRILVDTTPIILEQYKDYSILTRALKNQYLLTLKNNLIFKNNFLIRNDINENNYKLNFLDQPAYINYSLSNADTSIYLDALQISKENSQPKISYTVAVNYINKNFTEDLYNQLGRITRINDTDLKFNNVKGYISSLTLDLDNPDQDVIQIKNYKTKFEDLFSTITAQTEEMKKNNYTLQLASSAFTPTGELTQEILQQSIQNGKLNYTFDGGNLTINERNGIWGTNDTGIVAFRGGGIFTATKHNAEGDWQWNTGITPEGINANLLTSGQLDTNLIKIYAGDRLRFQMNGDGIFAYKSKINDVTDTGVHPYANLLDNEQETLLPGGEDLDSKQYVLFNQNGLSLVAKQGALVLNHDKTNYYEVLKDPPIELIGLEEIKRVQISWDGLVLRNWHNEEVFYADPDTGNLTLKGTIQATGGAIGSWNVDNNKLWIGTGVNENSYTTFVALNGGSEPVDPLTPEKTTGAYCFWAGSRDPAEAPFSIQKNGTIKATTANIGGWHINEFSFTSDYVVLYSYAINSPGSNQLVVGKLSNDIYHPVVFSVIGSYANPQTHTGPNPTLEITSNGDIYANNLYYNTGNGYESLLDTLTTLSAKLPR